MLGSIIKQTFDSLPHTWIKKSLEIVKISSNIGKLLWIAMEKWNTTFTVNGKDLGIVKIRRGIFQGDFLSPLFFCHCYDTTNIIFEQNKSEIESLRHFMTANHAWFLWVTLIDSNYHNRLVDEDYYKWSKQLKKTK